MKYEKSCGVDWLRTEDGVESTGSWEEFSKTFDTIIMGWNTYHQVRFEFSPDEWVYKGYKKSGRKLQSSGGG